MKNSIITFLLSMVYLVTLTGQGNSIPETKTTIKLSNNAKEKLMARGDSLFAHAAFMESVRHYQDLEHGANISTDTKAKMAEAYRCNAEYELAEYWYRQYIGKGADAGQCLSFAKVLQANDKCEEASVWYKRYLATDPVDARDIEILSDCGNLKSIVRHEEVIMYNLTDINTEAAEYSAMDMLGNLVFTSTRELHKIAKHEDMWTDAEFSDLFNATADEFGAYTKVDRLRGAVNKRYHDGVSAFDENEYRMYFTRNENKAKNGKRIRELKLYAAKVDKQGNWYDVSLMDLNVPGFSSCHPTVSSDGKTMVFASNRPGGHGGMDLYISKKKDDKWSTPQNLGKSINSPNNEIFPTISKTNDLFFSSNGHVGLGGLDLFRANLRNKKLESGAEWNVQNMGFPFNSIKDDFSYHMAKDGLSGYIASNRDGGVGKDDIYRWVRTTDDPLVLDWYKKNLCIDHFYNSDKLDDVSISLLEFADILKYPNQESKGIEVAETLDAELQDLVSSVIDFRQLRLLNSRKFKSNDPAFKEISMMPNRDYLIIAEKEGFFTSHKLITASENAIVYAPCIDISLEPYRTVKGNLDVDDPTVDITEIGVKIYNHCTNSFELFRPDENGRFDATIKCSCAYDVKVDQPGFEKYKKELENLLENCNGSTEVVTIHLKSKNPFKASAIKKDKVFTLNNILYDFNSASLTAEARTELNYLVEAMRDNPEMKIHLSSFTDSRGNDDYNLKLSDERARSAAGFLFGNGIDESRVQFIGMGESRILNDCGNGVECTDEEHKMNRRTEVKITSL